MSMSRILLASFLSLSLTSAAALADVNAQGAASAPATPDNSVAVTAPANNANAAATNVASSQAPSSAKKLQSVNINTADAKTIEDSLKGIGPKRAAAIVAYRTQNGPFKSVDDLSKVKGLSSKVVNENRQYISLG